MAATSCSAPDCRRQLVDCQRQIQLAQTAALPVLRAPFLALPQIDK
jgi:hypothetical protein